MVTTVDATWQKHEVVLRRLRIEVFVDEQKVPLEEEFDDDDPRSAHVLALAPDGTPVATGRLVPGGRIGRLAVVAAWRKRGVGALVFERLLELGVAHGHGTVRLSAQVAAVPFYERFGFRTEGDVYLDCGIDHIDMEGAPKAALAQARRG